MQSIIETFHIDWKIIIAQAVNFAIVFTVLYIYALKPLGKLMSERKDRIEKGLLDAKKSSEMLQRAKEEYEQNVIKLKKLSTDSQQELKKDLEILRNENIEVMKADTAEWVKNRQKQLEIDKGKLIEESKKEIFSLALAIAEKIMDSKIDPALNQKLMEELNNL